MPKGGKVTFRWRVRDFKKETRQALLMRCTKAGLFLRNQHRKNLNVPYPPASTPGQFPRRRTGRLRDGVLFEQKAKGRGEGGKYTGSVAVTVRETTYYWVYLYASGRLRLKETLDENSERLSRIMTSGKL